VILDVLQIGFSRSMDGIQPAPLIASAESKSRNASQTSATTNNSTSL